MRHFSREATPIDGSRLYLSRHVRGNGKTSRPMLTDKPADHELEYSFSRYDYGVEKTPRGQLHQVFFSFPSGLGADACFETEAEAIRFLTLLAREYYPE